MKVVKQICLKDFEIKDGEKVLSLERGKEYLTTPPKDGELTIIAGYWAYGVDANLFAGAEEP
jgi:hypothetical protein